jgi:hypothetical protein
MNTYKKTFAEYASDYLLQKRALGNDLSDEAHEAIEEIFAERGEQLPARPTKPIFISDKKLPSSRIESGLKMALLFGLVLLSIALAKALAHTWVGILVTIIIVSYATFDWFRKKSLTVEQRLEEENSTRAEEDGLNELMISSADGNLFRAKELIAFGINVNAQSNSGTTALMYAARNGHLPLIELLVSSGAEINKSSHKGSTAFAIAQKFGHADLCAYLEKLGTK